MSPAKHLVLRVIEGTGTGVTHRLTGRPMVVGRSAECDVVVPDPGLSRRHFELAWQGDNWQVRDLDSSNGLTVNGRRARQSVVQAGDRIDAGTVVFALELPRARVSDAAAVPMLPSPGEVGRADAAGPPLEIFPDTASTLPAMADAPVEGTLQHALLAAVPPTPGVGLYAVVDGAQAFDVAFAGRLMGHRLFTLFTGDLARTVAHVGPCLVELGERSGFLARWTDVCGGHAGVLLESGAPLDVLCAHLRHVFVATDEEGQEYFFRFYDPRVLRAFLPTCRADELREFFGPILRIIGESGEGDAFTIFRLDETDVREQAVVSAQARV